MKNTFKIVALALLAGAMMFTSCKKDDDENIVTPSATFAASFNNQQLPITIFYGVTNEDADFLKLSGAQDTNLNNYVELRAQEPILNKGEQDLSLRYLGYSTDQKHMIFDGEDVLDEFQLNNLDVEPTFTYTQFDATNLTISASASAAMSSYYDYVNAIDPIREGTITINANNVTLTIPPSKGTKFFGIR